MKCYGFGPKRDGLVEIEPTVYSAEAQNKEEGRATTI